MKEIYVKHLGWSLLPSKQWKGALYEKKAENRLIQSAFIILPTWKSFLYFISPFILQDLAQSSSLQGSALPFCALINNLNKFLIIVVKVYAMNKIAIFFKRLGTVILFF